MGKGGGGGNSYDIAYNNRMATLAEVTGGMGFNDYLRRYGYQLSPTYGGITNPMASYGFATGETPSYPSYTPSQPQAQQPYGGGGALPFDQGAGGYQPPMAQQTAQQPTYPVSPNSLVQPMAQTTPAQPSPTGGKSGQPMGQPMGQPASGLPTGSPFVQAVDMYGNPIISAIDLEDQAARLNYELRPEQQAYMMGALQAGQNVLAETGDPRWVAQRQAQARGEATANAMQAYNPANLRASLGRAGMKSGSGQFTDAMAKLAFERSKAVAGGRYQAGRDVERAARADYMQAAGLGTSAMPV
jgi:hypothetical protein